MKRAICPALTLALLLNFSLFSSAADSAKSLYNKGKIAEARQSYEQAYDFYKQAYDQKPQDLSYRASYERLRFLAGASHVHRGQLLREAGRLEEALAEFQKATDIDPASAIAKQELQVTKQMVDAAAKGPAPQASVREPSILERRLQQASGPVELAAIPNVPINFKATFDSKTVYETICKLAGINVLFDPDYTSRQIKVELNNVSLEEALQIVALESKTFWRPVTPNTIFVAADNPAKRKDLEQSVIKTFYLANLSQPTELQDVVNALRQILEISRIQPLPSEGAIVVRGTPDQVALAEKVSADLFISLHHNAFSEKPQVNYTTVWYHGTVDEAEPDLDAARHDAHAIGDALHTQVAVTSPLMSDQLMYSTGFGVRWFSPLGPLRFEVGFPLTRRSVDDAYLFEFTIGNFF